MRAVTLDCTVLSSAAARFMPPSRATASKILRSPASIDVIRMLPRAGRAALSCEHLTAECALGQHIANCKRWHTQGKSIRGVPSLVRRGGAEQSDELVEVRGCDVGDGPVCDAAL